MSIRSSKITPWVITLAPTLVVLGAQAAFAGTTDITQLDTAKTTLTTFVQGLAAFACIFLLGVLVWDFVQHRNIGRSIFEFLGVVMLGVIAINAGTVAGAFQGAGATL
jgi:hypothetical protein